MVNQYARQTLLRETAPGQILISYKLRGEGGGVYSFVCVWGGVIFIMPDFLNNEHLSSCSVVPVALYMIGLQCQSLCELHVI